MAVYAVWLMQSLTLKAVPLWFVSYTALIAVRYLELKQWDNKLMFLSPSSDCRLIQVP